METNIQEPNDDDMKIEEDKIDEIIKKRYEKKNNFDNKNVRKKN